MASFFLVGDSFFLCNNNFFQILCPVRRIYIILRKYISWLFYEAVIKTLKQSNCNKKKMNEIGKRYLLQDQRNLCRILVDLSAF